MAGQPLRITSIASSKRSVASSIGMRSRRTHLPISLADTQVDARRSEGQRCDLLGPSTGLCHGTTDRRTGANGEYGRRDRPALSSTMTQPLASEMVLDHEGC